MNEEELIAEYVTSLGEKCEEIISLCVDDDEDILLLLRHSFSKFRIHRNQPSVQRRHTIESVKTVFR